MKTRFFLIRTVPVAIIMGLGFVFSCAEDEPQFSQEAAYAIEESNIDAYYADADDMAGVAVAGSGETEGGKSGSGIRNLQLNDERFCNTVSVALDELSSLDFPIGDITLDFGTGCTDTRQNTRKGKVKIHFEGKKFRPNSSMAVTFDNYEINGMKLSGIRTITHLQGSTVEKPNSRIELSNGIVEWDGKIAVREHCFDGMWERGVVLAPGDDRLKITQCQGAGQAAEGTNRNGVHYRVFIEEELIYRRGCPMAVSGVKKFVEVDTGKEIVIDYGRGTCDPLITIIVNGNIRNVHTRR